MPVPRRGGPEPSPPELFLQALTDPARKPIDARDVAVIIAHPDDETIGCGAQLARLEGVSLVMVTDGAPRSGQDAQRAGFASTQAYADARARELREVLALAGVPEPAVVRLGFADQTAALRLVELTQALLDLFANRKVSIALTHTYEGGHPDHDATAFAVHTAARLSADAGQPLSVVEMPFYRAEDGAEIFQQFTPSANPETAVRLSSEEQQLKQRMLDAHVTQRQVLRNFGATVERFRRAPDYDFAALPNNGRLLYEQHDWDMTGARWLELVRVARRDLGLGA